MTENTQPPLIEIKNATVWRGATRVFHDFSLTIGQHERVAILGPNGAGKTTLLKVIYRELYPVVQEDSRVLILGRDRWDVWELREHIGMLSPDLQTGFTPNATVLDVIVSGFFSSIGVHYQLRRHLQPSQLEKSREVMARLGLDEFVDREFGTLSTGQQRRCLLGRALVHDPDTFIFDEPTSGLDLSAGFDYLARIRALARRGKSLVVVTHHLAEIPPEIERVIILKNGAVHADGDKKSVLTADVLGDLYGISLRVAEIDGHFMVYPGGQ